MQNKFCQTFAPAWQLVGYILYAVRILVPLIIIVLMIIELAKATTSSEDKAPTKVLATFVRKLIVGATVLFMPTIISVILSRFNQTAGILDEIEGCQVCLLRPTSTECVTLRNNAKANLNK